MEIKTKFGLGESIFYIDKGLVREAKIIEINIRMIQCSILTVIYGLEDGNCILEGGAFSSKKALHDYIDAQCR
jgi:hypothetical protein